MIYVAYIYVYGITIRNAILFEEHSLIILERISRDIVSIPKFGQEYLNIMFLKHTLYLPYIWKYSVAQEIYSCWCVLHYPTVYVLILTVIWTKCPDCVQFSLTCTDHRRLGPCCLAMSECVLVRARASLRKGGWRGQVSPIVVDEWSEPLTCCFL